MISSGRSIGGNTVRAVLCFAGLFLGGSPLLAQAGELAFIVMEPVGETADGALPAFRRVDDPTRLDLYRSWAGNESAGWALDLYAEALDESRARGWNHQPAALHVALVPGGNNADVGFRLVDAAGDTTALPRAAYLKLGPEEWRFASTFLHETGHVVMAALAGGRRIARRPMASIPHTTAALTDRGTAFAEGYAIHLETLLAHLGADESGQRYRHERFGFGGLEGFGSEYFRRSSDLLTFAQSYARYGAVRDNEFSFSSAIREPDYLRVQLDPARDYTTLRNANQLLQSEGFTASFFFSMLARGLQPATREIIRERQRRSVAVLADILDAGADDPDHPWVLAYARAYLARYPDETADRDQIGGDALDVLLDLSRGVFVSDDAAPLWRRHFEAALRLDLEGLAREEIETARAEWRRSVLADPQILESRLGPQLACEVADVKVSLVAFGEEVSLFFDANTVQEGVLLLVPGMGREDAKRWIAERDLAPFTSVDDLRRRASPLDARLTCTLDSPVWPD